MAVYELSFKIDYDYPFINMSRDFPDLSISMWCLWGRELLAAPVEDALFEKRVRRIVSRSGGRFRKAVHSAGGRIFIFDCTCSAYDSVWKIASANHFLDAPPALYSGGWGMFRLMTFEEENIRPLFKELNSRGKTELLCKREMSLDMLPNSMWLNCVLPDLTDRQREALLTAQRCGYYSTPRNTTTDAVAKSLGIGRSTFEDHLRRAENKIISSFTPYLQLSTPRMAGPPAPKRSKRAFS